MFRAQVCWASALAETCESRFQNPNLSVAIDSFAVNTLEPHPHRSTVTLVLKLRLCDGYRIALPGCMGKKDTPYSPRQPRHRKIVGHFDLSENRATMGNISWLQHHVQKSHQNGSIPAISGVNSDLQAGTTRSRDSIVFSCSLTWIILDLTNRNLI